MTPTLAMPTENNHPVNLDALSWRQYSHQGSFPSIAKLSLSTQRQRFFSELEAVITNASQPDWNGYGAKPLDINSVKHVCNFVLRLPSEMSYPELLPSPTGELLMEWMKNNYHLLVSISPEGQITWGGTSPNGHLYGDARFDSAQIPEELLQILLTVEGKDRRRTRR